MIVQFMVNKEGKVANVNVVRSVDPYLDAEARGVILTALGTGKTGR